MTAMMIAIAAAVAVVAATGNETCIKPCAPIELNERRCLTGSLGESICIGNGSVVMMTADALVNAANNVLHDEGGVAAAFVECGGKEIQTASDALIDKNGPLGVSQTAVRPTFDESGSFFFIF